MTQHGGEQARALFERCRAIDPARVAEDAGVRVTGRGPRRWARCPFHPDSRPSLVMDQRGWHCFGCGKGGDAVAFFALLTGLSAGRAARALAARYLGPEGRR